MSETIPKPPEVPPPIHNIEQLADLVIAQELQPAHIEERKEIDFERNKEIKDDPVPSKNQMPMVPIAQVIQAKAKPTGSIATSQPTSISGEPRIRTLPIIGPTPYAQAISYGFVAALIVIAITALTQL